MLGDELRRMQNQGHANNSKIVDNRTLIYKETDSYLLGWSELLTTPFNINVFIEVFFLDQNLLFDLTTLLLCTMCHPKNYFVHKTETFRSLRERK